MNIDWSKLGPVLRDADALNKDQTVRARFALDQAGAALRDALAQVYGLDLDDEQVVYLGFVWHGLIWSQINVAHQIGLIDCRHADVLSGLFRGNTVQLAEHTPAEARS